MTINLQNLKNSNIAVGFFGISYLKEYNHWMSWKTNPDWRKSNYKTTLYEILAERNNKIDHYFSTYHHELEQELIDFYRPKNYLFNEFENGKRGISRHKRFTETIGLFENNYDYYIMTRFDIYFKYEQLLNCNISNSSINVTSKHGCGNDMNLLCDSFYFFNNSMLDIFKCFLENIEVGEEEGFAYHILHRKPNAPDFSYMIEGSYYSHNCPVWTIIR
jgi:hypothetical protein